MAENKRSSSSSSAASPPGVQSFIIDKENVETTPAMAILEDDVIASSGAAEPASKKARKQEQQQQQQKLPKFHASLEDVYRRGRFSQKQQSNGGVRDQHRQPSANLMRMRRTNDEVHGSILFPATVAVLVDTLPFQRLRDLKQLGTAEQAYINCCHTRFEHSFGVYHLAVQTCESLRKNTPCLQHPVLGLTPKDELCVGIAALLHDIGHGPFSHTYERFLRQMPKFLTENPSLRKEYEGYPPIPQNWAHEQMSLKLVDSILEEIGLQIDLENLDQPLKQITPSSSSSSSGDEDGIRIDPMQLRVHDDSNTLSDEEAVLTSRDFIFVKEAIYGKPIPTICDYYNTQSFVGRPWDIKAYLYNVVSNSQSGLDADKLDYLARDASAATGDRVIPQYRILEEARLAKVHCVDSPLTCTRCRSINSDGTFPGHNNLAYHYEICYPKKLAPAILDNVFLKRRDLHGMIYKHHTVECANLMICDILCNADPFLRLPLGNDGSGDKINNTLHTSQQSNTTTAKRSSYSDLPLSLAMLDINVYVRALRDGCVLGMISNSNHPQLKKARQLVKQYQSRRGLYKMAAEQPLDCRQNEHDRIIWEQLSAGDIEEEILQVSSNVLDYHSPLGISLRLEKEDFQVSTVALNVQFRLSNT